MKNLPSGVILDRRFFNGNWKEYGPYAEDGAMAVAYGGWEKIPNTALKFISTDRLTVPDFPESNLTEGTIFAYGLFTKQNTNNRIVCKNDATGNNYDFLVTSTNQIAFLCGSTALVTYDWVGAKSLAVTFKTGEVSSLYRDGSFADVFNVTASPIVFNQDIVLGNYYSGDYGWNNPMEGILVFNRKLSASEMTEVQEWVNEQQSITKPKEIKNYPLDTDKLINDPDILHAYDFKLYNNKVYDLVGGDDLEVYAGSVHSSPSLVGNMIDGPANIRATIADTANDEITMEFYGSMDETGNYSGPHIGPTGLSKYIYIRTVSVFDKFAVAAIYDGSNSIAFDSDVSAHDYVNKPVIMHATISDSDIKFYINGVEMSGTVTITGTPNLAGITRERISMNGSNITGAEYKQHNGWFASFDTVKSAEWVANRALQFRKTSFFDDLSDANISVADNTSGMLENTRYGIASGSWKILEEEVFGRNEKVIECTSTGRLFTESNQAYGTWEFDWKLNSALLGTRRLIFMDTRHSAFENGYGLAASSSPASLAFQRYLNDVASNLAYTATGYLVYDIWYKFRVTRTEYGEFTWYIKGGIYTDWTKVDVVSGTNPTTENATTKSNYMTLDFYSGDKITNIKFTNQVVDPT